MIREIANATDEAEWLRVRRGYITASDIFKLLTHEELCEMGWWKETWMDDSPDDIFQRKLTGDSPEFKDPVAVLWGQKEEDHNRELFQKYSGVPTWGTHALIHNDRWRYLATTLDGYVYVPDSWTDLSHPEMFDDPEGVLAAIRALPMNQASLLEMKQTSDWGIKAWQTGYSREPVDRSKKSKVTLGKFKKHSPTMPVYYLPQVQTQMAITGVKHNLAVVKGGASHMLAHAYKLSRRWIDILDALNERYSGQMEEVRNQI
jgi:hypothetical protein